MTPQQFKQIRAELGLTQTQLAKAMQTSRRTIARYEGGESKIDGPIEVLMGFLARSCKVRPD